MTKTDNNLTSSLERLSSGLRINKAADDASGMSIADSLKSQALGLGQAIKNANDGINIVQTADAALEESINIVNTIKTKAIQAAQDGQTTASRAAIQSDINKLMEELDNIAKTTSFNGQKLLSGNFTDKKFQIGAYSGETVNISIGSTQADQIGHTTTGKLVLADNKPGYVELAFYSSLQNKNFEIEGTEVKYNNSRDNSLGMVADSINRLSDVLGITATADVRISTNNSIGAGVLKKFSINGVLMDGTNVVAGDSNRALTVAINSKTAQHGVRASIQQGHLTLTSMDGRAIKVEGDPEGMRAVFNGQDMSTIGHINLTQPGANDIIVTNIDGGNAVELTNNMNILKSEAFTDPGIAMPGSKIARNSVLGAGWTTNMDITTSATFSNDLVTTEESLIEDGSLISKGSRIALEGTITGNLATSGVSTAFSAPSTISLYSTISKGSVLSAGSQIGTGVQLTGDTVIAQTAPTTADNILKSGSLLTKGTVLAANTELSGVTVNITQTQKTAGESIIKDGSTIAEGSKIAAGTVLSGLSAAGMIIEGTDASTGESKLGTGSTILIGSTIGAGTTIAGVSGVVVQNSDPLGSDTVLAANSKIAAQSVIAAGSQFDQQIKDTEGRTWPANTVISGMITVAEDTAAGTGTLRSKSILKKDSVIGDGTTFNANFTLAKNISGTTADMTLAAGTKLTGGSTLARSSQMSMEITLRTSANISGGDLTLKGESVLMEGTTLRSGSKVGADITLTSAAKLTKDMTALAGSVFGENTSLKSGSTVHAELTLTAASTLGGNMSGISREVVMGTGSILASGSQINKGSSLFSSVKLGENALFEKAQKLGKGSLIKSDGSFIKAGSTIGAAGIIKSDLSIINDKFMLAKGTRLAQDSMLSNGSSIGGKITLSEKEIVEHDSQMQLNFGSTLARGSKISAGTYLTNDIQANDGKTYKAGYVLEHDITTDGVNYLFKNMTLKGGSVISDGSTISVNTDIPPAIAEVEDMKMGRLSDINVLTQEGAQIAISIADSTLTNLDKVRADLGSVQNQMAATISNISTTRVNVTAAESTIRDVDFADESAVFSKMQVLQQAGTFAMSQANASAQSVLSLLQ